MQRPQTDDPYPESSRGSSDPAAASDPADPSRERQADAVPDWPSGWLAMPEAGSPESVEVLARAEVDTDRVDDGQRGEDTAEAPHPVATSGAERLRHVGRRLLSRADPGPRGLRTLIMICVAAVVVTLVVLWLQRPQGSEVSAQADPEVSLSPSPGVTGGGSAAPDSSEAPEEGADILVAVVGEVKTPGLVELPSGSRVADALTAAGGAREDADLTSVNLAQQLVDGEQVVLAALGEDGLPRGPAASSAGGAGAADALVDLNRATSAQLETLPGVGPVLAGRIVQWREENGPFRSVDQLREVGGIGASRFEDLRERVGV